MGSVVLVGADEVFGAADVDVAVDLGSVELGVGLAEEVISGAAEFVI